MKDNKNLIMSVVNAVGVTCMGIQVVQYNIAESKITKVIEKNAIEPVQHTHSIQFTQDQKFLYTFDKGMKVYDIKTQALVKDYAHGVAFESLALKNVDPYGKHLVTVDMKSNVMSYDLSAGLEKVTSFGKVQG